jgi:hypothetical protein
MCDVVVHLDRGTAMLYTSVDEGIAAYQGVGGEG